MFGVFVGLFVLFPLAQPSQVKDGYLLVGFPLVVINLTECEARQALLHYATSVVDIAAAAVLVVFLMQC